MLLCVTIGCLPAQTRRACKRQSELEQNRPPGEATAHALEHQQLARKDLAAANPGIKRQRYRRSRSIAGGEKRIHLRRYSGSTFDPAPVRVTA